MNNAYNLINEHFQNAAFNTCLQGLIAKNIPLNSNIRYNYLQNKIKYGAMVHDGT